MIYPKHLESSGLVHAMPLNSGILELYLIQYRADVKFCF